MIDILKIILGKRDIDTKSIFTQATLAASSEHWKKTIEENILICE